MGTPQDLVSQIDNNAPDADIRHSFSGGSEVIDLLGESTGCTRRHFYIKTGVPADIPSDYTKQKALSMRAIMNRGHIFEDVAARIYMNTTGRSLLRRNRLVRNPDHPHAGVHTDRLIVAFDERGTGDAEIKTHSEGPFLNILRNGLPIRHSLQLQWSMFCTGHRWGSFIILGFFGEGPLKYFDVERDLAWMQIFARAVDNFWNMLEKGEMPPQLPDPNDARCKVCRFRLTCRGEMLDPEEYHRLINEREGKKILKPIVNDELNEALADRALIRSEMEALNHDPRDEDDEPGTFQLVNAHIKEMVEPLIGDEEVLLVNRYWRVHLTDGAWSGLDIQRLREEQPELYKRYYISRKSTGKKVLRVYAERSSKEM